MSRPGAHPVDPNLKLAAECSSLVPEKISHFSNPLPGKEHLPSARINFGTNRALSLVMARFTFVALFALGTADALALGGNRRRLLKLGSAAGLLGGSVERFSGGGAANAATAVDVPLK